MRNGNATQVPRMPTGIPGFDAVAGGGLPRGRTTLVIGAPGAGKTTFGIETLAQGIRQWDEPGIFVAFEERAADVERNASSFPWFPRGAARRKLLILDGRPIRAARRTGELDLEGVLSLLDTRVKKIGAQRIVFDGINALLALFDDPSLVRREILRLSDWLAERSLSALVTFIFDAADPASIRTLHLQSLSDCVVLLDREVVDGIVMRSAQVLKFRGGTHSPHRVPMLITPDGIEMCSTAGGEVRQKVFNQRVSSGVAALDDMLGGGYFRGTWVLVTGMPGTAKSTLAGAFAEASCRRGERTLFVSFDEGADQITRNLASVGIRFAAHRRSGLLRVHGGSVREASATEHMLRIQRLLETSGARNLVIDPVSAWGHVGGNRLAAEAVTRLLAFTRAQGITAVVTALTGTDNPEVESTELAISTIADTWLQLSYVVHAGERNRALTIVKSRGMGHSNQVRELVLANDGIGLTDVYTAGGEVLMGTLRWEKEEEERRRHRESAAADERSRLEIESAIVEGRQRLESLRHELARRREQLRALDRRRRETGAQRSAERARIRSLRGGTETR